MTSRRAIFRGLKKLQGLLSWLFAVQLQVVLHPATLKAVLTPRRAGKTELACTWLLDTALKHPGCKVLYICLTRPNAKDIAWTMLKKLCQRFSLGAHFHESNLDVTLPNGSVLMLRGADQAQWIERLEGQEFALIVVDESGLYNVNLRRLVYGSLRPMVVGCGGTICLIGRPGDVKHGLFYDVTRQDLRLGPRGEGGAWPVDDHKEGLTWAVFNWSTFDNPYMVDQWKVEIDTRLAKNPELINDPVFRRHYLGEWCEDAQGNVYAFDEGRNCVDKWDEQPGDHFIMATDFGWDDSQGFMIGCWSETRPEFWLLESYKQHEMPLKDALDRIDMYRQRYPGLRMTGDPVRKQLYMEMAIRFGEVVTPAEKHEKHDYIDLMNNDYALGRIKVVRETNKQFIDEVRNLKRLIKEKEARDGEDGKRVGPWVEHPRQPNDLCDCSLYAWRKSRHFRYAEPTVGPQPGSTEFYEAEARRMWEREAERAAASARREWWRR